MIAYEDLKLVNASFETEFHKQFSDFLSKGWYILGNQVKEFETNFAEYNKAKNCIGVANGLDALILSLKSCNFKKGDEVIVPSNTYIATILAVLHCELTPVLLEPDMGTYNIDPSKIEEKITPRTKAMLIVHLYGKCCDMDPIMTIKKKHDLVLIEDCAQAHGAKYKGQIAGTFGEYGAFSFYPTKNLGALGDAGAVVCESEENAVVLRQLRNYGSERKYYNERIGYNSRLDELQAAFLNIKLQVLDTINEHKRKLAGLYLQHLKKDFILPVVNESFFDIYHIFNIRHPKRDELKAYLLKNEIGTEIHYPVPPHKQKAMGGINWGNQTFPISEEIHSTTLSLPCSYGHKEADVFKVIEVLNKF